MATDPTQIVTRIRVGRDEDNDIVLDDSRVSRHHAELTPLGGDWIVRDLDSGNGTLVNGTPATTTPARAGDRVQVGTTTLLLTGTAAKVLNPDTARQQHTTMVAHQPHTPQAAAPQHYSAGDIVNGHVLSSDGAWMPVAPSPAQQIQGVQQVIAHVQKPIIPGRAQGIASLVLGISAWTVGILLLMPFISVVLGLIGLPLGIAARKESDRAGVANGQAVAGIWLNAIGLVLAALATIIIVWGIALIASSS